MRSLLTVGYRSHLLFSADCSGVIFSGISLHVLHRPTFLFKFTSGLLPPSMHLYNKRIITINRAFVKRFSKYLETSVHFKGIFPNRNPLYLPLSSVLCVDINEICRFILINKKFIAKYLLSAVCGKIT